MKVLDCTLRDGGYYNNWDFCPEIVQAYLNAVATANIDYVELGLRNFPKSGFLGAYAYTTEQYLNSMELPKGPTYGVMVDAKTILSADMPIEEAIEALFVPADQSKVDLVRVAAHFNEVEQSGPIVKKLKSMGYLVGYNLMQSGGKDSDLITDKARQAKEWDVLDVLYFADSLGNMDGTEVKRIIDALRKEWQGPLGIHTHNNMGQGLDNTLTAASNGVTWLDTTITGMGRGAGNTQTENLLAVWDKKQSPYNSKPIYDLVIRHFEAMQKQYGWGSNLLYFLGAQNDVHPTYIQNLLSNTHYGTEEIVGAIDYLSQLEGTTSYNGSVLNSALSFNSSTKGVSGSEDLFGLFENREVLVITNGQSTTRYKNAIEQYIKQRNPIVISININKSISSDLIDYVVVSHNVKFLSEFDLYKNIHSPVILPKHRFSDDELNELSNLTIIDVGFDSNSDKFTVCSKKVSSPYDLTSAYLFGLLKISQAKSVNLVGFDGYEKGDIRQQEMVEILTQYNKLTEDSNIIALTPTTYPLLQGSIYAIHS